MNIESEIRKIRNEQGLTQEEFGSLFHVTRQAVSNWETGKTYPDLQTLVDISNRFSVSLDTMLKTDTRMVKAIDRERAVGAFRQETARIGRLTGAGTGIVVSCLFSPSSALRTAIILLGIIMIGVGWHKQTKHDHKVIRYMEQSE